MIRTLSLRVERAAAPPRRSAPTHRGVSRRGRQDGGEWGLDSRRGVVALVAASALSPFSKNQALRPTHNQRKSRKLQKHTGRRAGSPPRSAIRVRPAGTSGGMGHTNGDPRGRGREGNHGLRSTTDCAKLEREEGASQGGARIRRHNTEPMLSVCDSTCERRRAREARRTSAQ